MSRDDFIHKATLLSDQQKHSECLELCEKEIAIDDKNANALLHKSACLIKLKKLHKSIIESAVVLAILILLVPSILL